MKSINVIIDDTLSEEEPLGNLEDIEKFNWRSYHWILEPQSSTCVDTTYKEPSYWVKINNPKEPLHRVKTNNPKYVCLVCPWVLKNRDDAT